ncbi:MAG: hypothetical protein LIP28_00010 [Deltaproteobacteria bacterium]|nr:hypothetical protein [Deltaproteobacteria bacterium]
MGQLVRQKPDPSGKAPGKPPEPGARDGVSVSVTTTSVFIVSLEGEAWPEDAFPGDLPTPGAAGEKAKDH